MKNEIFKNLFILELANNHWGSIERGKQIHESNVEAVRKTEEAHYEKLQTSIIETMRADGKSDSEIDEYVADWVQTIKVWGSNEKPKRIKEIHREKLNKD